jgi:hypothetical protein
MNDYFDQVEHDMAEAVRRHAHMPWYIRIRDIGRSRALVVVLAALVVATPAVGAVSNWFGLGAPDRFPPQSATQFAGRALPGTSELLPLRVPDPQGGPPWGLRVVRTTRSDTCIQLGRIEDGKLGSLGIDYAWNDDHLFHPFPNTSIGDDCGTTDAVGDGFVNVAYSGVVANANPRSGASGPQARSCRPLNEGQRDAPLCPPGSTRVIFMGLLGPDATSVTYQAPDGSLKTESTSGSNGAYLLVFTRNKTTCNLYTHGQFGGFGPCGGTESIGGASPDPIGAVKAVGYRDGHTCRVTMPQPLYMADRALLQQVKRLGRRGFDSPAGKKLQAAFLAREHLKSGWLLKYMTGQRCPPVGYVAQKVKPVTAAEVATPISVRTIRARVWCSRKGVYRANTFSWIPCSGKVSSGYQRIDMTPHHYYDPEVLANISLTARQPVTSSHSWYEIFISDPGGCQSGGTGGALGFGNIRTGQKLRFQDMADPRCRGVYHGTVGYMQNSGPINQDAGGGRMPGKDGSVIVGRFTFAVH